MKQRRAHGSVLLWAIRLGCVFLQAGSLLIGCSTEPGADAFVDDRAALLTATGRERIADYYRKLYQDFDIHLKVATLKESPTDLDAVAVMLFAEYALGSKTRGSNGVLLLVDPEGRRVRMEIGYDLEGVFPDGFVGYVEERQMAPFFRAGRVGDGVEATVELLVGKVLGAIDEGSYLPEEEKARLGHLSGGGGAKLEVGIGEGEKDRESIGNAREFGPQATPMKTLETYRSVLARHIKDPELGIYTEESRKFFRQWLVTDAQQSNELRGLQRALLRAEVFEEETRAVIRFAIGDRQSAPYLLRRDGGGWRLDFAVMSRLIGFNHKNQWFFRSRDHDFMFAFADWRFDRHGFPHLK